MIAELPGVRLAYDDVGSGAPVVFIHGFPHDRTLWAQQVAALSTQARCIAVDLRGFGGSTTEGPWSVDQHADDVLQLMDHLEIDRAVICGLSMGGYVAMAMWRRHASRVRALILCDTKAGGDTDEGRRKRNDLMELAERDGAMAVVAMLLPGMIGKTTRDARPTVVEQVRQMMERASVSGIVGALTALRDRPDATATLRTVVVPTLVLVGEEDALTPPSEAGLIMAALPDTQSSRLEIIADAGHVSCVERPAAVTHVLSDFLATLPVPS